MISEQPFTYNKNDIRHTLTNIFNDDILDIYFPNSSNHKKNNNKNNNSNVFNANNANGYNSISIIYDITQIMYEWLKRNKYIANDYKL